MNKQELLKVMDAALKAQKSAKSPETPNALKMTTLRYHPFWREAVKLGIKIDPPKDEDKIPDAEAFFKKVIKDTEKAIKEVDRRMKALDKPEPEKMVTTQEPEKMVSDLDEEIENLVDGKLPDVELEAKNDS